MGVGRASLARVALGFWLGLLLVLPGGALEFPPLSGRVVDEAGILDQATRAAITEKLAALEAKTTDQLVVVTLKSSHCRELRSRSSASPSGAIGRSGRKARTTARC
jgi:uncharacterized membrane protein YgcG